MAIKSNLNGSEIDGIVQRQKNELYDKMLNSFVYAGLKFITNAREQVQDHAAGTYEDDTTNLRNSIQFFVFHDGKDVYKSESPFSAINMGNVTEFVKPTGFQLILIAGMNYASYVESKGYNVISYQADQCIIDLSLYLEDLGQIAKGSAAELEETFMP